MSKATHKQQTLYDVRIQGRGSTNQRRIRMWAENREVVYGVMLTFLGDVITITESAQWWQAILEKGKPRKLRDRDVLILMETLLESLEAGIALERALQRVTTRIRCPWALGAVGQLWYLVSRKGRMFSEAMQESNLFPLELVKTIQAGEIAGNLPQVLKLVVARLTMGRTLVRKVAAGCAYPMLLLFVGVVAFIGLGLFVLPQTAEVFREAGYTLPAVTAWMLSASSQLAKPWFLSLFVIMVGMTLWWLLKQMKTSRKAVQWLATIPQLGEFISGMWLLRPLQTLVVLLRSGVPATNAFIHASRVARNTIYKQYFLSLGGDLVAGHSLELAMMQRRHMIPEGMDLAVSLGGVSDTGNLVEPLERYLLNLEEKLDARVSYLPKLLEPILLTAVFGLILLIVVSAIMPGLEFLRQSLTGI